MCLAKWRLFLFSIKQLLQLGISTDVIKGPTGVRHVTMTEDQNFKGRTYYKYTKKVIPVLI